MHSFDGSATKIRPTKLGKKAADHLRREILEGRLKPGDTLPSEAVMMQTFGISRPTLREAIRILESLGLVVVYRGKKGGAEVTLPTKTVTASNAANYLQAKEATLKDILEARICIEPMLIRYLEGRLKKGDFKRLRSALEPAVASDASVETRARAVSEFRTVLFGFLRNPALDLLAGILTQVYTPMARQVFSSQARHIPKFERRAVEGVVKTIDLMESGDFNAAAGYLARYLQSTITRVTKLGFSDMRIDSQVDL